MNTKTTTTQKTMMSQFDYINSLEYFLYILHDDSLSDADKVEIVTDKIDKHLKTLQCIG